MAFDFSDNVQKIFSALTSATALRGNVANTLLSSGINLMQNKKYAEAASAFRQAAAMQPDLVEAYTFQGDAYARLGKKKEAIAAYKLSLRIDKTQDAVYTNLANVYIDNGQKSEAEKVLKDGIKQNKLNTLAYYTLGLLQEKGGRYAEAESNFRQVIKLEPKDGNGYYALGLALNGQKRYEEAVEVLQKATELKKEFVPALLALGRAYAGLDDLEKAQEQVDALNKIRTSDALISAQELAEEIRHPKIYSYNDNNSTLSLDTPLPDPAHYQLSFLHPDFLTGGAGASKDFTVQFAFDSDMDMASVMNPLNWRISKASGGTAGLYNNGLYTAKDVPIPYIPKSVAYDPTTRQATLSFTIRQFAGSTDGTIDPAHLVFAFLGKDVNGKSMDPTADQYDGFVTEPF